MDQVRFGIRVEVPLKNKLYSGIIVGISDSFDGDYRLKPIYNVIDKEPIIFPYQYKFWLWMARYYCAAIGEVMQVALPSVLKLSSETQIVATGEELDSENLTDEQYLVAEAVSIQNTLTIEEIKEILGKKSVYPIIRDLIDHGIIRIKEKLVEKYKPRTLTYVRIHDDYSSQEGMIDALNRVERSKHQTNALLTYVQLSKQTEDIPKKAVMDLASVTSSVISALEKKGIFEIQERQVSRLVYKKSEGELSTLSSQQISALQEIRAGFQASKVVLLQGVTGSGKTRVYMEMIQETIAEGKQVLFLLPEIALTSQMVARIRYVFGTDVGSFHSKMNNQERAELWSDTLIGKKIILGARSSLFLPFSNLGLIIVDEEHDPSYKQHDPSPRYNARDAAVYLAKMIGANILLGSATPSMESHANVRLNRYCKVTMAQRYGNIMMPAFEVIDLQRAYKTNRMKGIFSLTMIKALEQSLRDTEQVIIFQNRRGYAPVISCEMCGWRAECKNCDVSLTYHKYLDECKCHYCHYRVKKPIRCPACGHTDIIDKGHGTQKIAEEMEELLPDYKIGRLDHDTTRGKSSFENILSDFALHETDVLVGTQMVAKGLDFDNIGIVGIVNADSIFRFPDFRADERGYQLIVQVAGRAGRKKKRGKVLLQTFSPSHPIIVEILNGDYDQHIDRVLQERKEWTFPPYCKMIALEVSHRDRETALQGATYLYNRMYRKFQDRISSPFEPSVACLKGKYLRQITIKIERDHVKVAAVKALLLDVVAQMRHTPGIKSVRVKIDVDPY